MQYDDCIDEVIDGIKNNGSLWNVIKDEQKKTFSIFGPALHDFDFLYLFKKLQRRGYTIQLDSCFVSSCSYEELRKTFIEYGFNWEDPALMMNRLILLI